MLYVENDAVPPRSLLGRTVLHQEGGVAPAAPDVVVAVHILLVMERARRMRCQE